jgi:hypothetical protein
MNQQEEPPMDQLAMFSTVKPMAPADDDVAPMCESARDRMAAAYRESPRHRRRRFAFALTGGSLLAAGAAAAAVTLLAGNPAHQDSSLRSFVTAAYTVRPDQGGTVTVTIKQLQDPAGLQRALTADGVPALVRYIPARNVSGTYGGTTYNGISPVCQYLNLPRVPGMLSKAVGPANGNAGTVFWIRPSALPKGSVVFIQDSPGWPGSGGSIAGIDVLRSGKLPRCVPVKPPSPQQIVSPHS